MSKILERQIALRLRREGKSYSEILQEISVAKSTLGVWLKNEGLAQPQIQRITEKRIEGQRKGARARHDKRILDQDEIYAGVKKNFGELSMRDLLVLGIALYWAEGSKESANRPGSGVVFTNEEPRMILAFIRFLEYNFMVFKDRIYCELYIHNDRVRESESIVEYWSDILELPKTSFRIYLKHSVRSNSNSHKKEYHGTLRIKVKSSSDLLRQMEGYVRAICSNWGVV
ncbi:MAG: hypothetical protein NT077_03830 [Candidatus Taylorbacteria bacterium]|nr:hypothetical protein [Candidatus Taylorbacteria bacterium]